MDNTQFNNRIKYYKNEIFYRKASLDTHNVGARRIKVVSQTKHKDNVIYFKKPGTQKSKNNLNQSSKYLHKKKK